MATYSRGLRSGETVGVKPVLQIRFWQLLVFFHCSFTGFIASVFLTSPGVVKPVAGIAKRLVRLLGDGLDVATSVSEDNIAVTGLRNRNAMVITERLELAVGPRVKDPVLDIDKRILDIVFSLGPGGLNLGDELVPVLLSVVLDLNALLLQICSKLVGIPAVVGLDNIVIPVLLDAVMQVLAVCRRWIRDVVI